MYKQYNNDQGTSEFPIEITIPDNHAARVISLFVDSMPDNMLPQKVNAQREQRSYDP